MIDNSRKQIRFPAEWEPQDAILLVWPHKNSDWSDNLQEVQKLYLEIIAAITRFEKVVMIVPPDTNTDDFSQFLTDNHLNIKHIVLIQAPSNDTWSRDMGPVTVYHPDKSTEIIDFQFNGWGNRYPWKLDNQLTPLLSRHCLFTPVYHHSDGMVLEGGSIETDGQGTLLTTSSCLMNPNRNPELNNLQIEEKLKYYLGIHTIHWLDHGYITGDDTDGHVDTLARFAPGNTILYVQCQDPDNQDYKSLTLMEEQLLNLKNSKGNSYHLSPLPMAPKCIDHEGNSLPATYANYLVINQAVLLPVYGEQTLDQLAINVLQSAFPDREIIGIDCRPLIAQNGSLHCISMQLPRGVLK